MRPSSAKTQGSRIVHAVPLLTRVVAFVLCFSLLAYAKGNTFNRVRYNGGSVASKVDPKDWGNKLTVTSDTITLEFKDGQKVDIPAKSVTSISYGQEAHRRVGTMVALAIRLRLSRSSDCSTRRVCTTSAFSTLQAIPRMRAFSCKAIKTITAPSWWRCRV